MKYSILLPPLLAVLSVFNLSPGFIAPSSTEAAQAQNPSSAGGIRYVCGKDKDGTPTTVAKLPNADVVVIKWMKSMGDFNPQKRCEIVSGRFQTHAQNRTLKFITSGTMNGQQVICVAGQRNGGCLSDGLLFTLRPGENPRRFLVGLLNLSKYAGAPPLINNCYAKPNFDLNSDIYIDIAHFLYQCPSDGQGNNL